MAQRRGYKYLLGDSKVEAERLAAQARLWDPVAHALFDRAQIRAGTRVLEIGPGRGSLNGELRRRTKRPVDVVEPSATFAENLRLESSRDVGPGQVWQCFLKDAPLPRSHYDVVFARWVFLFLPEPLAHVKKLVRALKPGGRLVVQDYQRETFALIPKPEDWADFAAADLHFFSTEGGNASIGARLPHLFRKAGLVMEDITPHIKTGKPGTDVWNWLTTYFMGVMDRYAKLPPFTPAQARRVRRQWQEAEKDPTSVLIAPAVVDLIGRKPRRA
jgi:SAM-dependent methyltransferase